MARKSKEERINFIRASIDKILADSLPASPLIRLLSRVIEVSSAKTLQGDPKTAKWLEEVRNFAIEERCRIQQKSTQKFFAKNEDFQERLLLKRSLLERDGRNCHYCGVKTTCYTSRERRAGLAQTKPRYTTIDHVIPRSKGGLNTLENLVICCYRCNDLRDVMPYEEFKQRLPELIAQWEQKQSDRLNDRTAQLPDNRSHLAS